MCIRDSHDPIVDECQIKLDLKISDDNQKTNLQFGNSWSFTNKLDNVFKDSHAVVILTEWGEYSDIDWLNIAKNMKKPGWVFDSRLIVNTKKVLEANLKLWRIGDGT